MFLLTVSIDFLFFPEAFGLSSYLYSVIPLFVKIYLPRTIMQQIVALLPLLLYSSGHYYYTPWSIQVQDVF